MSVGDTLCTHIFGIELGSFQVETVQEVSALTLEQDVVETKQVTPTGELLIRKEPGARQAGEVTVTRGLDKSKVFTDWVKATLQKADLDTARQNITIAVMDAKKNPVRRYQLSGCWASRWEGPMLQAGEASPATEKVTIVYEEIDVE
ncbi:phage tail protein [Streptomyces yunnanensis]|nr:phage tail protein [Streptomyces yunnanensis]